MCISKPFFFLTSYAFKRIFFLFCFLVLTSIIAFAQDINITSSSVYDVAGNGINTMPNYGRIYLIGSPYDTATTYYRPGSYGGNDNSSNNTITINSPVTGNNVYGAVNWPFVSSTVSKDSTDVALKDLITASSNTVNVCNNVTQDVFGSYSILNDAINYIKPVDNAIKSTFSFCNNTVIINNFPTIDSIYCAYLYLTNVYNININSSMELDNNFIVFNSSAGVNNIYAAHLSIFRNSSFGNISLSNNTVDIKQEIINCKQIYVACLNFLGAKKGITSISSLNLNNNKIIVSADNLNMPNTSLGAFYINYDNYVATNISTQNNTLQIDNAKNITVKEILNFDMFKFILPASTRNDDTILKLANQDSNIGIDLSNNKVDVDNYEQFNSLVSLNLIDITNGVGNISITNSKGSYLYNTRTELKLGYGNKSLIFTFDPTIAPSSVDPVDPNPDPNAPLPDSVTLDPQTIVISEGATANIVFVGQGLDLVMDEGLFSARRQTAKSAYNNDTDTPFFSAKGFSPFTAFTAAKYKYFTGTSQDIDTTGFSIIAGLAKDSSVWGHNLTLGLFYEHGQGKYETYNFFDYDNTNEFIVAGKGNANYNGGGLLARLDLVNNIYFDASARLGNTYSDFLTFGLNKLSRLSYDYSTTYYGAHGGLGYLLNLNDNLGLDFSGKYFFTNLAGREVNLPENQTINFSTESVQKVKIGVKLHHIVYANDSSQSIYCGGAFEYEPTNKIEANIRQRAVDTPELGGGLGIIEAGFNSSYKNLSIDLSTKYADGHAGNSIDGILKISYKI
ncbi:MAG: hypothetical protein LBF23_01765 [Endomicrobium sp.]|jgi:hypothetical protein|nr:hypothetical protein [Endomicrobium sp.]